MEPPAHSVVPVNTPDPEPVNPVPRSIGLVSPLSEEIGLLEVGLLGGFSVRREHEQIPLSSWQRRPAKTLIKLLATFPTHGLHREQIVELLWPNAELDSGLNSFGKALHAARRALEPDLPPRGSSAYLRLTDSMLILDPRHVDVDADRFERLAVAALKGAEVETFEAALAAYGGTLLPEDLYEDWAEERRNYLAELHIRLLSGLGTLLARRGALNEAADRLREALQRDPTREDIHRRLMRLYVEMGIPDLALRQFHVCEDNMRRLLDLAPRPETIAVYEELMTVGQLGGRGDEPISEPVAPPVLSASSAPAATSPFVGREPILSRLLGLLSTGEVEGPRMVFVSGEAGIGKTRLLEELSSRAHATGAAVLWGGVGAHAQGFGYGAFAVALEAYAASCSDAERAELSRRYPALGRIAPSLMGTTPPPAGDVRRLGSDLDLIQSIVRLITDLSRERPVLVVLGDLHDADEFTVDLMRYVAHLARHRPWLIVATVREDDIDDPQIQQLVSSTLRERLAQWIELECLSRADCDRLVRHLLGSAIDEERLQTFYETSRGNPVYIEALTREVLTEGADTRAREGGAQTSSDAVWRRHRAAATMQLGMMSATVRRVLELASLSSAPSIEWEDLRGAAAALTPRIPEDVLFDVLDYALRTRILEETEGGYVFRYPMVRAALRDSLPRHRRAQLLYALGASKGDPAA